MSSPNMRFQSTECSDWVSITLSTIADVIGGGTPSTSEEAYWNGDVQWFTPSEITSKYVSSSIRTISEEGVRNSSAKPLPKGSILFTSRATLGLSAINCSDKLVTTNQGFQSIIPKDGWSSEFVYYLINRDSFLREVKKLATGSTFPEISPTTLKSIIVNVPESKNEQQKIAEFFTALDEKIHSIENKLSLLDRTKKYFVNALLQKKLRFVKDNGSTYTDWVSCNVANIADVIGGGTPSTTDEAYWNGDINWFTPAEINSKYLIPSKRKISKLGLDNSSAKLLPKNSLLLTTRASLGLCSINSLDSFVCTNQGFQSLICKENAFHEFVYYMVTSDAFKKELKTKASGSTFLEVSSASLKSIKIEIPCYEEQIKIANFISQMDLKIELLVKQKKVFEKMKKAFMQRMFV